MTEKIKEKFRAYIEQFKPAMASMPSLCHTSTTDTIRRKVSTKLRVPASDWHW